MDLPGSLNYVSSSSITSINHYVPLILDTHSSLTSVIHNSVSPSIPSYFSYCYYLRKLNRLSTVLSIPNDACNSNSITTFDLSAFTMLQSVIIGNENFMYAGTFIIDNLINLRSITIRRNSFTKKKNGYVANDSSRSFGILNCNKLESIEIGRYSFSDYGGGFELKNLPKLSTIEIGEIGFSSCNFWSSSFVIRGIIDVYIANE